MASLRLSVLALFVGAVALGSAARADGPRPVTAAEAATPTCFGASADGAFAVRVKLTCDPTTAKCESASYLSRLDWSGRPTTVAYLTYLKGEGRPAPGQLALTAKPEAIAKAQAAMAEGGATMSCGAATIGQTFTYGGGKHRATIEADLHGGWRVRGDNARSIVVTGEALVWVDGSTHWYAVSTTTTPDGTLTDTIFAPVDASQLFEAPPRPASAQSVGITHGNIAQPMCRGFVSKSGAMLATFARASGGVGFLTLVRMGGGRFGRDNLIAKTLPPFITDPMVALAGSGPDELALANDELADVDAACDEITLTTRTDQTVTVGGQPITVSLKDGMLTFTGPRGARYREAVSSTTAYLYVSADPRATEIHALLGDREGGHSVIAIAPLMGEPALFPVPTAVAQPTCLRQASGITLFEVVTRKPAGAGEQVKLEVVSYGSGKPSSVATLATADVAAGGAADGLLAAIDRATRIDLAERLGQVTPCALAPLGADLAWTLGQSKPTLFLDGAQWKARREDGKVIALGKKDELGTPRWTLSRGDARPDVLVFAPDDGGAPVWREVTAADFDRAPDSPEVAARAPKLLKDGVPTSNQKRCLAWNSKDLSAWIARPLSTCGECPSQVVLTEVRKDGYYKRVTLAQDGSDWTHMFDHANGFISKADLGCVDEERIVVLDKEVTVTTDESDRFVVASGDKKVKVDGLKTEGDDGARSERVNAIFWHPSVPALVIEVAVAPESGGSDMRYVWVDLGKVGVRAAK